MSSKKSSKFLFKSDFQPNFKEYFNSKEYCDVKLIVGNKSFDLHKAILISYSGYFETRFSSDWSESSVIKLEDERLNPDIIEDLLNYIYGNEICLTEQNAYPICMASHYLQIKNLVNKSQYFLCRYITTSNAMKYLNSATKLDLFSLISDSECFIRKNRQQVFKELYIQNHSYEEIILFLKNLKVDCFQIYMEELRPFAFELILNFIENDPENHALYFDSLIEEIDFDKFDYGFLIKKFTTNHLVRKSKFFLKELLWNICQQIKDNQDCVDHSNNRIVSFIDNDNGFVETIKMFNLYGADFTIYDKIFDEISNFGFASLGSKVYFGGGKDKNGKVCKDLKMFDCINGKCEFVCMMPGGRYDFAMASLNGYLYITGGYDENHTQTSSVYRYCPETDNWKNVPPMLTPRFGHEMIELHGNLYVIGGRKTTLEEFNSKENCWKVVHDSDVLLSYKSIAKQHTLRFHVLFFLFNKGIGSYEVLSKSFYFSEVFDCPGQLFTLHGHCLLIAEDGTIWNDDDIDPELQIHKDFLNVNKKRKNFAICEY